VLNQYYWPGVEATAHLLAELCEALAAEFEITVVTGRLQGRGDLPSREVRNGVEITRVESAAHDRTHLTRRALNYLTYLLYALRSGMAQQRPDVVICGTDPPIIGDVALAVARKHRVPLIVISEDVFPEIAVALHRLENGPLVGLLRLLVRLYLRRADRVVAIGDTMKRRLEAKGARPERVRVIPNWTDVNAVRPQPKANAWSMERGLADRFVVMHSGNVGHAQDLDTLIRATTLLRDLDDLRVVVIGTGARRAELVELGGALEADKVNFLDFQPRERLPETLATADVHVVGLARGLAGYVVPSRLYSVLAAGRPVIATRLSFDYGWYPPEDEMLETDLPFVSLWYAIGGEYTERGGHWQMTAGDPPRSVIIASEPLTTDFSTWLEVPEYSMLTAELTPEGLEFETRDLDV